MIKKFFQTYIWPFNKIYQLSQTIESQKSEIIRLHSKITQLDSDILIMLDTAFFQYEPFKIKSFNYRGDGPARFEILNQSQFNFVLHELRENENPFSHVYHVRTTVIEPQVLNITDRLDYDMKYLSKMSEETITRFIDYMHDSMRESVVNWLTDKALIKFKAYFEK